MTTMSAPATADLEPLLTVGDVAALCRVHRLTVYRILARGELRGVRVGSRWRFRRDDIEEYLRSGGPVTNCT